MYDRKDLVERYVALWHETDQARRRAQIESLWVPNGAHYSPALEAHGYEELSARVLRSHKRWVIDEGYVFRLASEVLQHHDTVTFAWEMLPRAGGAVISEGRDFLMLAEDGRMQNVYQFVIR